ncbi:MAG: hypothetical protein JW395_3000 [Nitrospira sp.]|nr:hypothetical protein [Nitrospira sp.]
MAYSYELYNANDEPIDQGDVENRATWYESGASQEEVFARRYGQTLGVCINPEKTTNPAALDLLHHGCLADLKCQQTPLFTAKRHYKIDPTYAVTFNLKDAFSYGPWGNNYPGLQIFYWVDWVSVRMVMGNNTFTAQPLQGVWRVPYATLEQKRKSAPIHWYFRRWKVPEQNPETARLLREFEPRLIEDQQVAAIRGKGANAACSYVFDLNEMERVV